MNDLVSWFLEIDDTYIYYIILCFNDNHLERVCSHCYNKNNAINFGKRLIKLYQKEGVLRYV